VPTSLRSLSPPGEEEAGNCPHTASALGHAYAMTGRLSEVGTSWRFGQARQSRLRSCPAPGDAARRRPCHRVR